MATTLRRMIDHGQIAAASPLAQHVAQHLEDPLGSTKEDFEDLTKKRLDYEVAKENARRKLLPVQSVLDHVNQVHQLDGIPNPADPDDPDNPDMEQGATALPGVPGNMQQVPGRQQMNKPAGMTPTRPGVGPRVPLANPRGPRVPGSVPGQSARPTEAVRPPKMGMPQPGQARPGQVAGNPSARPKPKAKTAAGKPGQKIKVEVHSSARKFVRRNSLEAGVARSSLRFDGQRKEDE